MANWSLLCDGSPAFAFVKPLVTAMIELKKPPLPSFGLLRKPLHNASMLCALPGCRSKKTVREPDAGLVPREAYKGREPTWSRGGWKGGDLSGRVLALLVSPDLLDPHPPLPSPQSDDKELMKCNGGCQGLARYCSKEHQKAHWGTTHKSFCQRAGRYAKEFAAMDPAALLKAADRAKGLAGDGEGPSDRGWSPSDPMSKWVDPVIKAMMTGMDLRSVIETGMDHAEKEPPPSPAHPPALDRAFEAVTSGRMSRLTPFSEEHYWAVLVKKKPFRFER